MILRFFANLEKMSQIHVLGGSAQIITILHRGGYRNLLRYYLIFVLSNVWTALYVNWGKTDHYSEYVPPLVLFTEGIYRPEGPTTGPTIPVVPFWIGLDVSTILNWVGLRLKKIPISEPWPLQKHSSNHNSGSMRAKIQIQIPGLLTRRPTVLPFFCLSDPTKIASSATWILFS